MRMWNVDPSIMCRKHLIGEWHEIFMIISNFKNKRKMDGFIKNNLLEPLSIPKRYEELKQEMLNRNYKPMKKLDFNECMLDYLGELKFSKIDSTKSLEDLCERCPECKNNLKNIYIGDC